MQGLNMRKVANDWTDTKAISIFESLLAEEKRAYQWWHEDLRAMDLTMDRANWTMVRKAFKERWLPLPEPKEDTESKREELEQMRLREEELGIKVAYQGQELYSHIAFANRAACLANKIGDINGFLLPTICNQLPEAIRKMLKGLGKKPKTWEDFRKAMTTIQLSDLQEEAAEITKRDGFYAEVAAMHIRPTGHSPGITRAASQPRQTTAGAQNWLQTPQATLTNTLPPRYQPAPPTPRTPTQNRMPFPSNPRSNPFPMTPDTGRNPPATGTNTT